MALAPMSYVWLTAPNAAVSCLCAE